MEETQLDTFFKKAIKELKDISGRAFVLDSFLLQTRDRIINDEAVGHELMTATLAFHDVTLEKGSDSLILPPGFYELNRDNLADEVDMILSRECLFYISQAYEVLETFLYDNVAEFIRVKSNFHIFIDNKAGEGTYTSIRKALKNLDDRKNNKHLLRIIRANNSAYAYSETNNIWSIDFQEWFEMLSEIRHCITHQRMLATSVFLNMMPKNFTGYLSVRHYKNSDVLFMTYSECGGMLTRIVEYIFLVYKSLAEAVYEIQIDRNTINELLSTELSNYEKGLYHT